MSAPAKADPALGEAWVQFCAQGDMGHAIQTGRLFWEDLIVFTQMAIAKISREHNVPERDLWIEVYQDAIAPVWSGTGCIAFRLTWAPATQAPPVGACGHTLEDTYNGFYCPICDVGPYS